MRVLLFVLLSLLACSRYSYAWTASEWLGVIEATAGTVVLRPHDTPSSDICENCSGTGRLGDGTVSVECPVCKGTGKPVKYSSKQVCDSCDSDDTMESSPAASWKSGPGLKQDAVPTSQGQYKGKLFRWRR